jgi:hypothetical protein
MEKGAISILLELAFYARQDLVGEGASSMEKGAISKPLLERRSRRCQRLQFRDLNGIKEQLEDQAFQSRRNVSRRIASGWGGIVGRCCCLSSANLRSTDSVNPRAVLSRVRPRYRHLL